MADRKFQGRYRINGHDTVVSVPTAGLHRYLITQGSAWDAVVRGDSEARAQWRHEFLKHALIPFVILVFILVFPIGFHDLSNIGFWMLLGVFAVACLLYSLLATDPPLFEGLPDTIVMTAASEDAEYVFGALTQEDRDTLFRAVQTSYYSTDQLLEHLGSHYRRGNRYPWKPRG
ncbi:hypothetical protein [Brevibacterium iodinum]|nr:hypothetical protein [Brevibacterium iodinum]